MIILIFIKKFRKKCTNENILSKIIYNILKKYAIINIQQGTTLEGGCNEYN